MKKQKILLIIMLIFNISLSSQITINGKVIDRDSQKPLSFANIKIAGTFLGTVSGNDGSFSLQVKSLPVTLIISFIGYQTDTIVVNENQFLTIYLAPKSILTDEITVTAIRLDDNSPKNFTNLSIEKIQSLKTG
ncbi:MAG TPA: carboxypeptidase-like regulatory domain-containing protein, partial [Bacteroidales bacterium]|nr:carboxypeptidase-like regulatory domain-containing protein [Bacteroidales bacterium]